MSVLIWGRRPRTRALTAAGERLCERCGLWREHTYVVDYRVNHLYYIFGFVSGSEVACRCTVCGETAVEPVAPELEERAKRSIPFFERFGLLSLGVGIALLVLLAVLWSRFGPQPRNIPSLLARIEIGDSKALARLEAEAERGDLPSQLALAEVLRDGLGVPADAQRAFRWARAAAQQGEPSAQFAVGVMYEWGNGVESNLGEAAAWYRKSAVQGNAPAANCLGALYLQGKGVATDAAQATEWFRKAAEAGNTAGQFNVAMRYWNGSGVAVDYVEARRWLERAATATATDDLTLSIVASSKQELGVIYEEGLGVERDLVRALRYYDEAQAQNGDARANFARLKARLND